MANPPADGSTKSSRGPLIWVLGCLAAGTLLSCVGVAALVAVGALLAEPVPGSPDAPVAVDPAAPPVGATGPRQTITTADLVGEWRVSASSSTTYVDRSSGAYAGSSSSSYGETFELRADSTYSSSFLSLSDGRVGREKAIGTWTLEGSKLLLTSDGHVRGWWFLSYERHPNGESTFVVLGDQYEVTDGTYMYRDTWVRAPE
jgi:hypothetical protein